MRRYKPYSGKHEQIIQKEADKTSTKELAKRLKRSEESILSKKSRMGITNVWRGPDVLTRIKLRQQKLKEDAAVL